MSRIRKLKRISMEMLYGNCKRQTRTHNDSDTRYAGENCIIVIYKTGLNFTVSNVV